MATKTPTPTKKTPIKSTPSKTSTQPTNTKPPMSSFMIALNFTLILFFIILSVIALYFAYLNIPGEPQELNIDLSSQRESPEPTQQAQAIKQFYPNMKFNHNNITYIIDFMCSQEKKQRVLKAMETISIKVPQITFLPTQLNPDIEVSCSEEHKDSVKEDFFIAGEGGAKEIIKTKDHNIITNGVILLYQESNNAKECEWPNIEIHELMHVFGFGHSENENSLMYPYLESCNQKLDLSITNKLKELYSQENLPDFYFEDINATKKGRYLDFETVIKNSGTIDATNITLTILDNQEVAETKIIKELKFGAGIILRIQNLKLIHKNPKEITFILNKNNEIKELDTKNNILKINLD